MNKQREVAIRWCVSTSFSIFTEWLKATHLWEIDNPKWAINKKKNNVFIAELWPEFMLYSALVRSFDSSFWNVLEKIWNLIWKLTYHVFEDGINSYLYPYQESKIEELINAYSNDAENRILPKIDDYEACNWVIPRNKASYARFHKVDNYFFDVENKIHYIIELKSWWDLDVKKAIAEKRELLKEYFMIRNKLDIENRRDEVVKIKFATAYNKDWEWNYWNQSSVRNCFADEELLIGKDYWNFICNDGSWFDVVISEYRKSAQNIKNSLQEIINAYSTN